MNKFHLLVIFIGSSFLQCTLYNFSLLELNIQEFSKAFSYVDFLRDLFSSMTDRLHVF